MTQPVLTIGNKNYSSWSMRPWLALRWAGVAFEERVVPLGPRGAGVNPAIAALSDTARVPVLELGGVRLHESLAICEWAAEQGAAVGRPLLPADPLLRALVRSASAEMHAGFAALRRELPMNLRRRKEDHAVSEAAAADIARVQQLWERLRARTGHLGPWLGGQRSIADAMFAPVATRFRTYGTALSPVAQAWCDTLLADPDFQAWDAAAADEPWTIPETDAA
jgi:glutathione S-transferase